MKIIAIESSGLPASVALWEDGALLAEYTLQYKKTHSQTLLPMLDQIRSMTELDLSTVDAVAVASGPGSFTGLRIGCATAKGLGLALKKPIVEVPTLEGLAFQLWGTDRVVCPLMDARRNQVYTGIYQFVPEGEGMRLETLWPQRAADVALAAGKLNELGREAVLLGDGVPVYADRLRELLRVPYCFAPGHMSRQRAASLAALGEVYARQGRLTAAADHRPEYLRKSQAEREREEKNDHRQSGET